MSRSFAIIAVLLSVLTGCSLLSSQQASRDASLASYQALGAWLGRAQSVEAMDTKQVMARLAGIGQPEGSDELFYFGLLNQKLNDYDNWARARDAFRELSQAPGVTVEQRQLSSILLVYNQTRINSHLKYQKVKADVSAMQAQLERSRSEKDLLDRKIQAITDLETSISTRKEQ